MEDQISTEILVKNRFDEIVDMADEMIEMLIGVDWAGGYLKEIRRVIQSKPSALVIAPPDNAR